MKFLADECCDTGLVTSLRDDGHDVLYVLEKKAGVTDEEVLFEAYNDGRILLTEDKDFGYLEGEHYEPLKEKCRSVVKMLGSMLKNPESFILRL